MKVAVNQLADFPVQLAVYFLRDLVLNKLLRPNLIWFDIRLASAMNCHVDDLMSDRHSF